MNKAKFAVKAALVGTALSGFADRTSVAVYLCVDSFHCGARGGAGRRHPRGHYSTAFTMDSMTFLASPNTIIVFG
jgi:hypothetical protein